MKEEATKKKVLLSSKHKHANAGQAVYGLGLIGALVYYFQHANGFEAVVLGIIKGILWPAFLIYRVHQLLGM